MIPAPQSPATPTEATRTTRNAVMALLAEYREACEAWGREMLDSQLDRVNDIEAKIEAAIAPPSPPAQDGEAGELLALAHEYRRLAAVWDRAAEAGTPSEATLHAANAAGARLMEAFFGSRIPAHVVADVAVTLSAHMAALAEAEARAAYWEAEMKRERRPVFVGRLPATSYGAPIPQAYLCTRCGRTFGGRFGTDERDETCPYCAITNELKRHHIMLPSQSAALASASPEPEDHAND